jgi:hypothetical protein
VIKEAIIAICQLPCWSTYTGVSTALLVYTYIYRYINCTAGIHVHIPVYQLHCSHTYTGISTATGHTHIPVYQLHCSHTYTGISTATRHTHIPVYQLHCSYAYTYTGISTALLVYIYRCIICTAGTPTLLVSLSICWPRT